jgi:hypothetical protein
VCGLLQTIAAAFSYKSPFTAPLEKQSEMEAVKKALVAPGAVTGVIGSSSRTGSKGAKGKPDTGSSSSSSITSSISSSGNIAAGQQSDHLLLVAVFDMWRRAKQQGGMREASQVRPTTKGS